MAMFKTAKVLAPSKKSKNNKEEVKIKGVQQLAEIDALIKALGTVRSTLDEEIKSTAQEHFLKIADGSKPANFTAVDGIASASIELRKRSTASNLTDAEISLLKLLEVPTEKVVSTPKMYGINPIYAEDEKLLGKVEKALAKIVPDDFIVLQEEQFKTVVGDNTISEAFKLPKESLKDIIKIITCMAIKPKLESTDIAGIFTNVRKMMHL